MRKFPKTIYGFKTKINSFLPAYLIVISDKKKIIQFPYKFELTKKLRKTLKREIKYGKRNNRNN